METLVFPSRTRMVSAWIIILGVLEILFGFGFFSTDVTSGGDNLFAKIKLGCLALVGIITVISGVYLLKRKKWAWLLAFCIVHVALILSESDLYLWISSMMNSGLSDAGSFFARTFGSIAGYRDYVSALLYVPIILAPFLLTLILLIYDRTAYYSQVKSVI